MNMVHRIRTLLLALTLTVPAAACDSGPVLPGPTGEPGLQGEQGPQGLPGANGDPGSHGLSCWDLDGDGEFDPLSEDADGDLEPSVLDCIGAPGMAGEPGPQGAQGPQGVQGIAGESVVLTELLAGEACPHGGVEVSVAGNTHVLCSEAKAPCPEDMALLNTTCIDKEVRTPATFHQSLSNCRTHGRDVCTLQDVIACDNKDYQGSWKESDCGDYTDNDEADTFFQVRTSTWAPMGAGNFFDNMVVYTADNAAIARPESDDVAYFCCQPAR